MSDELEKTMSLTPTNSAPSALSLFHRSSKRQSGVPVELRGNGRRRVTLSRHFCFDPGVAKPSLSPLRARRAQSLSVPLHATDIPGGDVTNPTNAGSTSHTGTLTASIFWGEATVPSQAHRGHSRIKNYLTTSAAPTCCSCHSPYNPGGQWPGFSFRTVSPAQTFHPSEEARIRRSSDIP